MPKKKKSNKKLRKTTTFSFLVSYYVDPNNQDQLTYGVGLGGTEFCTTGPNGTFVIRNVPTEGVFEEGDFQVADLAAKIDADVDDLDAFLKGLIDKETPLPSPHSPTRRRRGPKLTKKQKFEETKKSSPSPLLRRRLTTSLLASWPAVSFY